MLLLLLLLLCRLLRPLLLLLSEVLGHLLLQNVLHQMLCQFHQQLTVLTGAC
jgi:hypothetical protein